MTLSSGSAGDSSQFLSLLGRVHRPGPGVVPQAPEGSALAPWTGAAACGEQRAVLKWEEAGLPRAGKNGEPVVPEPGNTALGGDPCCA